MYLSRYIAQRVIAKILKRHPMVKIGFTEHNSFNNYDSVDVMRERIIYQSGKCIVRYNNTITTDVGSVKRKWSRYAESCFMDYPDWSRSKNGKEVNLTGTMYYMFQHDGGQDGSGWLRIKYISYGKGFKRKVKL